jgi:hypothetical protein
VPRFRSVLLTKAEEEEDDNTKIIYIVSARYFSCPTNVYTVRPMPA